MFGIDYRVTVITAHLTLFMGAPVAIAQITPDNTLGAESSFITPDIELNNLTVDLIQGGAARGDNLFHSFLDFNIDAGRNVYFDNPATTQAIFSRVTGNNISEVFGTLGVAGNADLFLLNPNGILFGENAKLDISGSFLATTADAFQFENGLSFSATNPQAAPLLTVNIQPGLQFGEAPPAKISSFAQLQTGGDLAFTADDLEIQGQLNTGNNLVLTARNTATFRDTTAAPLIIETGQDLVLQGDQLVDIFALNHPDSGLYSGSNLILRSNNEIIGDAQYFSGGNFRIENLDSELGALRSDNDPTIRAIADVQISDYSGASLHIIAGGSVDLPGLIFINAPDPTNGLVETITLSNGETVAINGRTQPTLDVRAGVKPEAIGLPANILNDPNNPVPSSAEINVGNVFFIDGDTFLANLPFDLVIARLGFPNDAEFLEFNAFRTQQTGGKFLLTNQYQPNPDLITTSGNITAGNVYNRSLADGGVFLDARGDITLTQEVLASSLGTLLPPFYLGDGGDVTLLADGNITLEQGANIFTEGVNSGDILLASQGDIRITNNVLGNSVISPLGKGSTLSLFGNNIILDGSLLTTQNITPSIVGVSDAGNITIEAAETLALINGTTIRSETPQGTGGDISLKADELILSGTNVSGVGTNVQLGAPSQISSSLKNNPIFPPDENTQSNAGAIDITTRTLTINDGGQIAANVDGIGDGGDININVSESIRIDGEIVLNELSGIFSQVTENSEGNAGEIDITTGRLEVFNGAKIDATTFGKGSAGKVTITATDTILLDGSDFLLNGVSVSSGIGSQVASTATGNSGGIEITTGQLNVSNDAQISASTSGQGDAGDIQLTVVDLALTNGGEVLSFTESSGNSGTITVNASNSVNLGQGVQNSAPIISVETRGAGKAGNIEINTPQFTLSETARITATATETATNPEGGGSITISADQMDLAGVVGIFAETQGDAPAGQLLLKPYQNNPNLDIDLFAGSKISAATSGSGKGGDLTVTAPNNIDISGAGILSVETSSSGDAGTIAVTSRNLTLSDGVTISASTAGSADGGLIKFTVAEDINIFDSFVQAITRPGSTGKSGSIDIDPVNTNLVNSRIAVDSQGEGIGGDILVTSDFLNLTNSAIATETFGSDGGNISLNIANRLFLEKGSNVTATAGLAEQAGNGGNVSVFVPSIVASVDEDNNIFADAFSGVGGRIFVSVNELVNIGFQPENIPVRNDITASSEIQSSRLVLSPDLTSFLQDIAVSGSGIPDALLSLLGSFSGSVVIESEVEEDNEEPETLIDPSEQIDRRCIGSAPGSASQFQLVGRGGRSPQPTDIFDVGESLEDMGFTFKDLSDQDDLNVSTPWINSSKLDSVNVTATAIQHDENGKIRLIASDPSPHTQGAIASMSHNCL